jgi:hypothetical protein
MSSSADIPQFHAANAIRHAVMMVWRYRRIGVAMTLPWMAILALATYLFGNIRPEMTRDEAALRLLVISAISFFCVVGVSVHWHRYILLDETLPPFSYLTIDGRKLRYILALVGVMALMMASLIVPVVILQLLLPAGVISIFLAIPAYGMSLGLSLGLPAIAIDAVPVSYRRSWALAKPHFRQLVLFAALLLLIAFVLVLTEETAQYLLTSVGQAASDTLGPLVSMPFNMISSLVAASALTTLYGVLVEGRKI